jgi:hypothetical protein
MLIKALIKRNRSRKGFNEGIGGFAKTSTPQFGVIILIHDKFYCFKKA